jgi:hypothetical protein
MTDRLLKLYVDSTSLPLAHQMADFVACAHDPAVHKVITWLRLPLTAAQLAPCQAVYHQQLAAVSPAFVAMVRERVQREGFSRVEIHSNHYHAWRGVAPLLRALAPLLRPEQIQLHLYDDGLVGPVQRQQHLQHQQGADWPAALEAAALQLHAHVHDGQSIAWTPAQNHAWHRCWLTRYHWLRPDVLLQTPEGQAWLEPLADHVQPLAFDGMLGLTPAQSEHFLQLFGLDGDIADRVAAVTQRPDAILFTATGTWDPAWQQRMVQSQLLGIATLRQHGCFDGVGAIAFKPHPANLAHDHLLFDALQAEGGPEVLTLPPRVPLEVLLMAGLLPRTLIGVLGTFLATVPPAMVGMILCRQDAFRGGSDAPHIDFLVRAGQLQEQQLVPILTHD